MAENETTNQEPKSYDRITYASLDPPKEPDPEPFSSDRTGIEQASDELSQTRGERNIIVERQFADPEDFRKVAPGNRSVSVEHAADTLAATREFEAQIGQAGLDAEIAKEVDAFRAAQQPTEPQPSAENIKVYEQQTPEIQPESAPEAPKRLDQLLTGVPPEQKTKIIRDLAQYVGTFQTQLQSVVQQYQQGVGETLLAAEAAALAPFPELHGVPRDQIQAVVAHIGRTDPAKHAQITQHVARVRELVAAQLTAAQNLQQQQQALQQQASQQRQEALRQFAEHQDALLEKTTAWGTNLPRTRIKIANSIIEHYGQYGVSKEQVLDAYQTNPGMRHAATRELLADGIRYRMARAAVGRAAARPVPQVQRPGVSDDPSERNNYSEYARLSRQLPKELTAKQAAQLLTARRNAR